MKKTRILVVFVLLGSVAVLIGWRTLGPVARASNNSAGAEVRTAAAFAETVPLTKLLSRRPVRSLPRRSKPTLRAADAQAAPPAGGGGAIHDRDAAIAAISRTQMPAPSLSFDGISDMDNAAALGELIVPPDTSGDIGPNNYVQATNVQVSIFDRSGNLLVGPFLMSQLFAPLGTVCSTRDDGDPIVAYDPLADRWLLSEYCTAFPPDRQMIAISKTGDPTGAYFVYEFVMPNVRLNDFPKFGVWPDAYYLSTEEFLGSDFAGDGAFAFDRAKMLVGDPTASYLYFSRPSATTDRRSNLLPSDLDGLRPPPPGTPNTFVSYTATEYGDAADAIRLFDFHADFVNPANAVFTERPESPINVAAFDPTSPDGRADIAQPAPGDFLDSNSDRVNYRAAYRNFGTSESIVFDQTVRLTQSPDPYRAGTRVYEFTRTGQTAFQPVEQSTIGDSSSSRWIGGTAQDNQGNIAVSYNFVSDTVPPAIRYTGRLATEPAGTFRTEASLIDGDGVQKAFGWRWGDYGGMTVDPVDDCTFWITGEYYSLASQNQSDFAWLTRIGKFKFDECTPAPRSVITGTVTNAVTGQPIGGAIIAAVAYSRSTDSMGSFGEMAVVPGSYAVTASAAGYRAQTVNINLTVGQTLVQNFALAPVPVVVDQSVDLAAESCGLNGVPEPGATVTYDIGLVNAGSANTQDLVATLQPGGGVTAPGAAQHYGALTSDGPIVSRAFTFTVSSALKCGDAITLNIQLQDGASDLGTVVIVLPTGMPKVVLAQSFDRQAGPSLPRRWTTASSGSGPTWSTSRARSYTGPKSLFSPDSNQLGLNELDSPLFHVSTPTARLTFANWYDIETTFLRNRLYDGSVLEISIDGGGWQDIMDAGGSFDSGGYDGVIDSCCSNPLAGHMGWSGRSGIEAAPVFETTSVRLPASTAGHDVQLRWRMGTDIGNSRSVEGQYIDDILITDGYSCGCQNARP